MKVWGIVSEFYIMKEESLGGEVKREDVPRPGGYKRRYQQRDDGDDEDDLDEFGDKRRRANGDGDTWSKAERYNKG